jgi:hypothetical protein
LFRSHFQSIWVLRLRVDVRVVRALHRDARSLSSVGVCEDFSESSGTSRAALTLVVDDFVVSRAHNRSTLTIVIRALAFRDDLSVISGIAVAAGNHIVST